MASKGPGTFIRFTTVKIESQRVQPLRPIRVDEASMRQLAVFCTPCPNACGDASEAICP